MKLGNEHIIDCKLGTKQISKVLRGTKLIWPNKTIVDIATQQLSVTLRESYVLYGASLVADSLRWNGITLRISDIHPDAFNVEVFRRDAAVGGEWENIGSVYLGEDAESYTFTDGYAEDYDTIDYRVQTFLRLRRDGYTDYLRYNVYSQLFVDVPEPAVLGAFSVWVTDKSDSHIDLEWGRSEGADYYEVWYRELNGDWILRSTTAGRTTTVWSLTEGVTYEVYIKSMNEFGYYNADVIEVVAEDVIPITVEVGGSELVSELHDPSVITEVGTLVEVDMSSIDAEIYDVNVNVNSGVVIAAELFMFDITASEAEVVVDRNVLSEVDLIEFNANTFDVSVLTEDTVFSEVDLTGLSVDIFNVSVATQVSVVFNAEMVELDAEVFNVDVTTEETVIFNAESIEVEANVMEPSIFTEETVIAEADVINIEAGVLNVDVIAEQNVVLESDLVEFTADVFDVSVDTEQTVVLDADVVNIETNVFDASVEIIDNNTEPDIIAEPVAESLELELKDAIGFNGIWIGAQAESETLIRVDMDNIPPETDYLVITRYTEEDTELILRPNGSEALTFYDDIGGLTLSSRGEVGYYAQSVSKIRSYRVAGYYHGFDPFWSNPPAEVVPGLPADPYGTSTGENEVLVSWGVANDAMGYQIRYKAAADTVWNYIDFITDAYCIIPGLSPGTNYDVDIRTIGDRGVSEWVSTQVSTLQSNPTDPTPTPLTAPTLSLVSIGDSSINIEWQSGEGSSAELLRYVNGDAGTVVANVDPISGSYSDTDVSADNVYDYAIKVLNQDASEEAWSNILSDLEIEQPEPEPEPEPEPVGTALYEMTETSGDMIDSINGLNGTVNSYVVRDGNGYNFNDGGSEVVIPHDDKFSIGTGPFTLRIKSLKFDNLSWNYQWIISKREGATDWQLIKYQGYLQVTFHDASGTYISRGVPESALTEGVEHHITIVYTGGTTSADILFYIDGVEMGEMGTVGSSTFNGTISNNQIPIRVGGNNSLANNYNFRGTMKELFFGVGVEWTAQDVQDDINT